MVERLLWCLPVLLLLPACGSRPVKGAASRGLGDAWLLERAAERGLVEVRQVIPDIVVDLRYLDRDNVARRALYPKDMPCLLRRETAEKLRLAQEKLKKRGYQLCVWDAWRPPEVQLRLLKEAENPDLFRNPESEGWSGHCAGCSVDVTLLDKKGKPCEMPTWHDETAEHTGYHYRGDSRKIARNLYELQQAMHASGFMLLASEWWHFDDSEVRVRSQPVVTAWELGLPLPGDAE